MIISASYRSDIPALYGRWFLERMQKGAVEVANPYGSKPSCIDLTPAGAEAFVFWTKHSDPFLPVLTQMAVERRPFVVQFTINGYERSVERGAPPANRAARTARKIRDLFGPRCVVWRYDPILFTQNREAAWHAANFAYLASRMAGSSDEVVCSFAAPYVKTKRNLARAGIGWRDPPDDEKTALLERLTDIAADHGMRLTLCSQPALVSSDLPAGRCIDATRLSDIAGYEIAGREKGNRPGCLCAESRDIGRYDSCTLGCAYCYAVGDHATVVKATD